MTTSYVAKCHRYNPYERRPIQTARVEERRRSTAEGAVPVTSPTKVTPVATVAMEISSDASAREPNINRMIKVTAPSRVRLLSILCPVGRNGKGCVELSQNAAAQPIRRPSQCVSVPK